MRIINTLLVLICFSAFSHTQFEDLNIQAADEYAQKLGWNPITLQCKNEEEKEQYWFANDAKKIFQAGIVSIHNCSGTGRNFCSFYYQKAQQCMKLVTKGEFAFKGLKGLIVERTVFHCPEKC
jgi:hypothetical protein